MQAQIHARGLCEKWGGRFHSRKHRVEIETSPINSTPVVKQGAVKPMQWSVIKEMNIWNKHDSFLVAWLITK